MISSEENSPQLSFANGIFQILQRRQPCGISFIAMRVAESFVTDLLQRLVTATIQKYPSRDFDIRSSQIQQAVVATLDHNLAPCVIEFAETRSLTSDDLMIIESVDSIQQSSNESSSSLLPMEHTYQSMLNIIGNYRITVGALKFLNACLEYVCQQLLDGAGKIALKSGVQRITPRHLHLAIENNELLMHLMKATIADGGPIPSISINLK